jgi:hypothetical protein
MSKKDLIDRDYWLVVAKAIGGMLLGWTHQQSALVRFEHGGTMEIIQPAGARIHELLEKAKGVKE